MVNQYRMNLKEKENKKNEPKIETQLNPKKET
jgi:hypothetical protein